MTSEAIHPADARFSLTLSLSQTPSTLRTRMQTHPHTHTHIQSPEEKGKGWGGRERGVKAAVAQSPISFSCCPSMRGREESHCVSCGFCKPLCLCVPPLTPTAKLYEALTHCFLLSSPSLSVSLVSVKLPKPEGDCRVLGLHSPIHVCRVD